MVYDAFISYRRSDRDTADGVARFLDAFGLKVFVDRSSRAGTEWEPELREALAGAKVLVVLWSRSAASSGWVEEEWRHVAPTCCIVAIKLDGAPLPEELNRRTNIEGLDVGSRLLQRSVELMQREKLSPSQAQAQLVQELADDGIVLEPKRRDALGIFLGFLSGLASAAMAPNLPGAERAPAMDSVAPATASAWPPRPMAARVASIIGAAVLSIGGFALGYQAAVPSVTGDPPQGRASATGAAVAECPPAPSCPEKETCAACPPVPTCPEAKPCPAAERELADAFRNQTGKLNECVNERAKLDGAFAAQKGKLAEVQKALAACKAKQPAGTATTVANPRLLQALPAAAGGAPPLPVLR